MTETIVLTKAGPRLIDFYRDVDSLSILVNSPGMLFEKLELMTNRSALDGANVGFYEKVAADLTAIVDCPHEPLQRAEITVEPHRLGAELSIDLGPASMYQSELRIHTASGKTFRELIDASLGSWSGPFSSPGGVIAVLVAVRATGHHEHHASAAAALRRNAEKGGYGYDHGEHEGRH